MDVVISEVIQYCRTIDPLELAGLLFGILAVVFLIKEHILTWPSGIVYVLISFIIFWREQLYGDFLLHIVFLVLNIYGWILWSGHREEDTSILSIRKLSGRRFVILFLISALGIVVFAQFLIYIPSMIEGMSPSSLPYWDSTTSVLSVTGMWLTAKKYIDNWYYWFLVDILATGIYIYKGIHFYALLYFIYIGLAIMGYIAWKKSMDQDLIVLHD